MLNMLFKHVCFCSLSLSLALEHPSNYFIGEHLTQAELHSCLQQNHALHLHTPLGKAAQTSLSRAAHLSLPRLWTLIQRDSNEVRKHRNVARDQLFIQDRDAITRALEYISHYIRSPDTGGYGGIWRIQRDTAGYSGI